MNILTRAIMFGGIFATVALTASAQYSTPEPSLKGLYFGLSTGMDWSKLNYSDIDEKLYPENNSDFSGMFSFFFQYNFGADGRFGVRPEFAFLTRGGRLNHIGKGVISDYNINIGGGPNAPHLDDYNYRLKATYFDFRLPLIYNSGNDSWPLRPYAYIAPILGVAHKGYIDARAEYSDNRYSGVRYKLSKGNYRSLMFSGAVGVGFNWTFDINDNLFFLGVEANYQIGFTDTYTEDEKDGTLKTITQIFPDRNPEAYGTRKLNTYELKATLGIPLSVFKKKAYSSTSRAIEENYVAATSLPVQDKTEYEVKPCYSLEEILNMLNEGQSIKGKRICAIDDVQFDVNKSIIKKKSHLYLDRIAELIKRTGNKVSVHGHTDNTGTDERNAELSRERAEAVAAYLRSKGVDASKIKVYSYGASRPRETNDTEAGRRANRRVEFDLN